VPKTRQEIAMNQTTPDQEKQVRTQQARAADRAESSPAQQAGTHPLGTAAGAVGGAVAGAVAGIAAGPVGSLAGAIGGAIAGGALGSGTVATPPVAGPSVEAPEASAAARSSDGLARDPEAVKEGADMDEDAHEAHREVLPTAPLGH
jgi:phage tail tape-measure protein